MGKQYFSENAAPPNTQAGIAVPDGGEIRWNSDKPRVPGWKCTENSEHCDPDNLQPLERYNNRNELYFQCPHRDCHWTFQFAVSQVGDSKGKMAELYRQQLNDAFQEHLREKHPS